jgi:hypothetical protein
MKIPTLSKKEIQRIITEKLVNLRIIYEDFIANKLGKNALKEILEREVKIRATALKIKNPLELAKRLAIHDKNIHNSKVKIERNKEKVIYIIQECGYLRKDTVKRKQTCCKPCSTGTIGMLNCLVLKQNGFLLKRDVNLSFGDKTFCKP